MVASNMGVGIAGLRVIKNEVDNGKLVSWWIEGAEINWELGLARLRGGYFSPIAQTFVQLCHESFAEEKEAKAQRSKAK
jgi:DNA-binding transcriptional LysR family regulator